MLLVAAPQQHIQSQWGSCKCNTNSNSNNQQKTATASSGEVLFVQPIDHLSQKTLLVNLLWWALAFVWHFPLLFN